MNARDFITSADLAEEEAAAMSLRATTTKEELVAVWWRDAEHFSGQARERLQEEYALQLRKMGVLAE